MDTEGSLLHWSSHSFCSTRASGKPPPSPVVPSHFSLYFLPCQFCACNSFLLLIPPYSPSDPSLKCFCSSLSKCSPQLLGLHPQVLLVNCIVWVNECLILQTHKNNFADMRIPFSFNKTTQASKVTHMHKWPEDPAFSALGWEPLFVQFWAPF